MSPWPSDIPERPQNISNSIDVSQVKVVFRVDAHGMIIATVFVEGANFG